MFKSRFALILSIFITLQVGCGDSSEPTVVCAAPDDLCDFNEVESADPCAEDEAGCRSVEIVHCNAPWVRYCRSGGGTGGAGGD